MRAGGYDARVAETRRVRFRAEWVTELPADAEFARGDRLPSPVEELVVRFVLEGMPNGDEAQERFRRGVWHVPANDADRRGADLLVELGPELIAPGSSWRVRGHLSGADSRPGGRHKLGASYPSLNETCPDVGSAVESSSGGPSTWWRRPGTRAAG